MSDPIYGLGTTSERKNHSKIKSEVRNVTPGGMVLGRGERDTEHCYLDYLLNNRHLGRDDLAYMRYDTGYRLRHLYFIFRPSGHSMTGEPGSTDKDGFTKESEIGDSADCAETTFHLIMHLLPGKHKRLLRMICLEPVTGEGTGDFYQLVTAALDSLAGVYETKAVKAALDGDFSDLPEVMKIIVAGRI